MSKEKTKDAMKKDVVDNIQYLVGKEVKHSVDEVLKEVKGSTSIGNKYRSMGGAPSLE
ncbi:hypothetical protein KI387_038496, partial [Taxus chinensis]